MSIHRNFRALKFFIDQSRSLSRVCKTMRNILFAQFRRSPPFLDSPLKGPQAYEQRGSKDNTLRKMLFLLGWRRGSLARDQRHLPVARPTEVLISIFLSAAATSCCFLRRSSDRDMYGVIIYARHMAQTLRFFVLRGIQGELYQLFLVTILYTCYRLSKPGKIQSRRIVQIPTFQNFFIMLSFKNTVI